MKTLAIMIALLMGTSAFASQEFHCFRHEQDGSFSPSTFEITLLSVRAVEISTDWDIDGLYTANTAPLLLWSVFNSNDNRGVSLQIQGKMFLGRSGLVKQILHAPGVEDDVTVFLCKPGKLNPEKVQE